MVALSVIYLMQNICLKRKPEFTTAFPPQTSLQLSLDYRPALCESITERHPNKENTQHTLTLCFSSDFQLYLSSSLKQCFVISVLNSSCVYSEFRSRVFSEQGKARSRSIILCILYV
jgi:hypothetical protein